MVHLLGILRGAIMICFVLLSNQAQKGLRRIPKHIRRLFDFWVLAIEREGFLVMKSKPGYRDHALIGNRQGQRSSSLSKSWRIIYELNKETSSIVVHVLEVNKHEY